MTNKKHLEILNQGPGVWNEWREKHPTIRPRLSGANLRGAELSGINFRSADLKGADLCGVNLFRADLAGAALTGARLNKATMIAATLAVSRLVNADLSGAILGGANLANAIVSDVNLSGSDLTNANLNALIFNRVDISQAIVNGTIFACPDLNSVKGLDAVKHEGPSRLAIDTILFSGGNIPEVFLRGCGVPESFIVQIPALVAAMQPIQFYSCFISYSGKDEDFARRLHSRMRQSELRVWFAPEDMKGGDKLYDQIDRAIQVHDRLLLVLSESSLRSKWVELEIRRARKVELREGRRKLFPIRLVGYEALQEWVCIDSTTGEDLAEEVRSYFIPDFSNWKSHDDLEQAFARLLADLKASA